MFTSKTRKAAEAASLSRMGTAILDGHHLGVKWLPDGNPELGYTSGDAKTVNIAWYNEDFFVGLSETEQTMLRMGVFAHELLHQCLTNFEYTNKVCQKMTRAEAAVFMQFANTLEDPAIEYFAPNIFGGRLLDSLRFSIRHVYKLSPGIDMSKNAFSQLINALIHFGDMGVIKGHFTFPESYEYFRKIAPLYNEGITCPDSALRIDIARECMEISRPLWEEAIKEREFFDSLMESLMEELKKTGAHTKKEAMLEPENSDASERRSSVIKKITEKSEKSDDESDEPDEKSKASGSSDIPEVPDDADKSEAESAEGDSKSGESYTEEDSSDSDAEGEEKNSNSMSDEMGDENYSKNNSSDDDVKISPSHDESFDIDGLIADEDKADEIADATFEITKEMLRAIEDSISKEEERIESKKDGGKSDVPDELPQFDIDSSLFGHASCLNIRMSDVTDEMMSGMYADAVRRYAYDIKNLSKSLERIFKSDKERLSRATSGSYNVLRGAAGTTARIFDKRRDPDNLHDASVVLLVDQSGSMGTRKMMQAQKAAIVFAEALTAVSVPYYVVGFTADEGADAVHNHYVDWKNRKRDRESLISMRAGGNNFDGYSIRYAAKLLQSRSSNNRLLIVISDGEPACTRYTHKGRYIGIQDTVNAIKEARKSCTVFGIAVGDGCSPTTLQSMYGRDFIYCQNETLLSNTVGKKIEKLLAKK